MSTLVDFLLLGFLNWIEWFNPLDKNDTKIGFGWWNTLSLNMKGQECGHLFSFH